MSVNLTKHDSRLVTAAISYALAITAGGLAGSEVVRLLPKRSRELIQDATDLLAISQEGLAGDALVKPEFDVFEKNLNRLQNIARGLVGTEDFVPAVLEPIAADGTVTGPKQYQLWLTHEQIHLLHWAVTFVESAMNRDVEGLTKATTVYRELRETELTAFVDKFNQVHEAARVADGEGTFSKEEM